MTDGTAAEQNGLTRADMQVALGLALVLVAVYVATGPAAVEILDGQIRFEVAHDVVHHGTTRVLDPAIPFRVGRGGEYAFYGLLSSLIAVPLVALGAWLGDRNLEQALFSFTMSVPAALTVSALFLAWRSWGRSPRSALAWAAVVALATPWWIYATSTFDQTLHGALVLGVVLLGARAAARDSWRWAAAAAVSFALILGAQSSYLVLFPALVLAVRRTGETLPQLLRSPRLWSVTAVTTVAQCGVMFDAWWRFGRLGGPDGGMPHAVLGAPWVGLPGLLLSPGKSVLLYHPVFVLAAVGMLGLFRRAPQVATGALGFFGLHTLLISSLAFWSGDWAWGPRYLVVTLPVFALGLPWCVDQVSSVLRSVLITLAVVVQLLSLSLNQSYWCYEHDVQPWFFTHARVYWFTSPLLERPGEVLHVLSLDAVNVPGVPFKPPPYPDLPTYGHNDFPWADRHRVASMDHGFLRTLRPWWAWLPHVPEAARPFHARTGWAVVLTLLVAGLAVMRGGRRRT